MLPIWELRLRCKLVLRLLERKDITSESLDGKGAMSIDVFVLSLFVYEGVHVLSTSLRLNRRRLQIVCMVMLTAMNVSVIKAISETR